MTEKPDERSAEEAAEAAGEAMDPRADGEAAAAGDLPVPGSEADEVKGGAVGPCFRK